MTHSLIPFPHPHLGPHGFCCHQRGLHQQLEKQPGLEKATKPGGRGCRIGDGGPATPHWGFETPKGHLRAAQPALPPGGRSGGAWTQRPPICVTSLSGVTALSLCFPVCRMGQGGNQVRFAGGSEERVGGRSWPGHACRRLAAGSGPALPSTGRAVWQVWRHFWLSQGQRVEAVSRYCCNKLPSSGLKQAYLTAPEVRSPSRALLTEAQVSAGLAPSAGSRRESVSSLSGFWKPLEFPTHGPSFTLKSSITASSNLHLFLALLPLLRTFVTLWGPPDPPGPPPTARSQACL